MINIIRPKKYGKDSIRLIGDKCGALRALYGTKRYENITANSSRLLVSWGCQLYGAQLNKYDGMQASRNKKLAREIMHEAGVYTPLSIDIEDRMIIRPTRHFGGKNFHVVDNEYDMCVAIASIGPDYYKSAVFDKTHEYRVYCASGKVLYVVEKVLLEGVMQANRCITDESWTVVPWHKLNNELMQGTMLEALRAMKALGLDFGGVDVMVNSNSGLSCVCEVNTAPSITGEYGAEKFARYFMTVDKERKLIDEPWDFEKFKKPLSLLWKENQLEGGHE